MASLWVIIRTQQDQDDEENYEDPVVCGVYASKPEAIEEILKLYIEDDIDLVSQTVPIDAVETPESYDYRPTAEMIREQRQRLLADEVYNTYTNRGNKYTLSECILGAKHEFEADVVNLYQQSSLMVVTQ